MSSYSSASGERMGMGPPPGNTGGGSRLEAMKAQIQQKHMQEKEQKLLQMLDSQQQRAMKRANLSGTVPPKYGNGNTDPSSSKFSTNTFKSNTSTGGSTRVSPNPIPPGKVRQMFEDRRKVGVGGSPMNGSGGYSRTLAGIDKSYPLDPLDGSKFSISRSGSSKSDPPLNSYGRSRSSAIPSSTKPPIGNTIQTKARSRPQPLVTQPPNIGTKPRTISLDRSSSRSTNSKTPSPIGKPNYTDIGIRRSSSGLRISSTSSGNDENANEVIPKTTKYKDYAMDLEARESALGTKMKEMNIGTSNPMSLSPSSSPFNTSPTDGNTTNIFHSSRINNYGKSTPGSSKSKTSPSSPPKQKDKESVSPKRSAPAQGLEECHICHRHFASDRIAKHESICKKAKASSKKRKKFDPTKMRMEGTDAEPYIRIVSGKSNIKPPPPTKKGDWRKKHEEFINTIRAAKEYTQHVAGGGNPADLPPPPPSDNSDYIKCPYCGRKFSQGVADRHIPKCQNIKSNKR